MLRPSGPTGQTLAEWLRPSGRADERPQCRIHTGRATRRASAHVPSKEGTRVRLCAISRKEEQKVRAPPAGRPTPELAGDRPKKRRAPTLELDRPLVFFNTVGTCVFILDLSGYVSEVAHGSGTMFRGLVLVFRFPLEWFIAFLSFSTAPLLCPRLPATLAGGLSEDGPSAACLRSLSLSLRNGAGGSP